MEGIQAERLISTVDNISTYLSAIAGELEKQNAILAKNHEINKRQLELQEIYLEQKKDVRQGWVDDLNRTIADIEKGVGWTETSGSQPLPPEVLARIERYKTEDQQDSDEE